MKSEKKSVNLLIFDEFEKSPLGKFLAWALTVGRYIVVLTELVVLGAFLFRFKLDADLAIIGEKIKSKQAVIESFGDLEDKVREIQQKLKIIKQVEGERVDGEKVLAEISKTTPTNVSFQKIDYDEGGIGCEGVSLTELEISKFINEMEKNPFFSGVFLETLGWGGAKKPQIEFTVKSQIAK